jgi:hypothetical protein
VANGDTVIDVDDGERTDCDLIVERVDLFAAPNAVAGAIDQSVVVRVVDVFWNDGEVADIGLKIGIRCARAVRVEDDQLVWATFVSDSGSVYAEPCVLLVEDRAVRQSREVENDEIRALRRWRRAGGRCWRERERGRGCWRWRRSGGGGRRWRRGDRRWRRGRRGRRSRLRPDLEVVGLTVVADEQLAGQAKPGPVFASRVGGCLVRTGEYEAAQRNRPERSVTARDDDDGQPHAEDCFARRVGDRDVIGSVRQVMRPGAGWPSVQGDVALLRVDVAVNHATVRQRGEYRTR